MQEAFNIFFIIKQKSVLFGCVIKKLDFYYDIEYNCINKRERKRLIWEDLLKIMMSLTVPI